MWMFERYCIVVVNCWFVGVGDSGIDCVGVERYWYCFGVGVVFKKKKNYCTSNTLAVILLRVLNYFF